MVSRSLEDLYKPLKNVVVEALGVAKQKNLKVLIICTKRSQEEQTALWCQGRESLEEVNKLRRECGLYELKEGENKIVTWNKVSYHSTSPKAMAFDFCIGSKEHIFWDVKVDTNEDKISDYKEFADICKSLDINVEWGGDWKRKDYGHIQWKNGLNINQMKEELNDGVQY